MGKYCRVSRASSSASAMYLHARGCAACVRCDCAPHNTTHTWAPSSIGRFPHTSSRTAVKGATVPSPSPALWSPGRRGQIPLAAASISSRRSGIGIGQAVHNSSRSVDILDSFKSRAEVYDYSNSPYTHALCGYRRAERGRTDPVGAHEGSTSGQGPKQSRDPQQRSKRLRGITTSQFRHATAGKPVNRVSVNALLRSSTLSQADPSTSSRTNARPTSSQATPQSFPTKGKQYATPAEPHSSPRADRLYRSSPIMRRKASNEASNKNRSAGGPRNARP